MNDASEVVKEKRIELSGRLQQRYGYGKDQAEREIETWAGTRDETNRTWATLTRNNRQRHRLSSVIRACYSRQRCRFRRRHFGCVHGSGERSWSATDFIG